MDPDIKKVLNERFKDIDPAVQSVVVGDILPQHIHDIRIKYRLDEAIESDLGNTVALVLLGFTDRKNLSKEIAESLNVPNDVATLIASDIERSVFEPIRTEIDTFFNAFPEDNIEKNGNGNTNPFMPHKEEVVRKTEEKEVPLEPVVKKPTPSYRKPLTNTPSYGGADPYREPPTP